MPSRAFQNSEGREIGWNPIRVLVAQDPWRLVTLQVLANAAETEEHHRNEGAVQRAPAPQPKNTKKTTDLPAGEYNGRQYAIGMFRGSKRTILFLETADGEVPVHGHFLEKEVAALGGLEQQ
ncbi:MAG: hypothetical protein AB2556_25205, partial [Candidatus Thiodiazotropha sp.]